MRKPKRPSLTPDPSATAGLNIKGDSSQSDEEEEESPTNSEGFDTSQESTEDSSKDSQVAGKTVDVTLEFYDPSGKDFHGIKALLQSYLDGRTYAVSELVETVIQQVRTWKAGKQTRGDWLADQA